MKIYQCVHKYPPHIPAFERRWGITDQSSFAEIHDAFLRDGYASVYRLDPSTCCPDDDVFFIMWNYERLQHAWAREHDLKTRDLDEIRFAQIEEFQPDIIYDFSPSVSPDFAQNVSQRGDYKVVCWNGFLKTPEPPANPNYNGFVSLHRPFVDSWKSRGFQALELQPGIDPEWFELEGPEHGSKTNELIIYGQIGSNFGKREELVRNVAIASGEARFEFKCFAHTKTIYKRPGGRLARLGINLPFLIKWPDAALRSVLQPPKYGIELYETIRQSKAVLNNFTDLSTDFHSNMRIFETIGNGTILITPRGTYPEGLDEGTDYLAFDGVDEITKHVKMLDSEPGKADEFAKNAQSRMAENFSNARQYQTFKSFAENL